MVIGALTLSSCGSQATGTVAVEGGTGAELKNSIRSNLSCSLRQLAGVSCGKHLEIYCYILSGCCVNFAL